MVNNDRHMGKGNSTTVCTTVEICVFAMNLQKKTVLHFQIKKGITNLHF